MMALASRLEGIVQQSRTISSLREVFSWKLTFAIQTEVDKRQQKKRVIRLETDQRARKVHQSALKNLQTTKTTKISKTSSKDPGVPAKKGKRCPRPN